MKMIGGQQLKVAFMSGINGVLNDQTRIDSLNVFPVPDGDTGSNMASTVSGAGKEIRASKSNSVSDISSKFARGMLLGARGNSGVILSQIFKGFSVGLKGKKEASSFDLVNAFKIAEEYAYRSVMKPVEGTILTVIRETAETLSKKVTPSNTIIEVFKIACDAARKSVDNTPELLPILKEVGVVDSGGEGLFQFLNATRLGLEGKPVFFNESISKIAKKIFDDEVYDGEFGYCTEFIVELKSPNSFKKEKFQTSLDKMGNSIVLVVDEEILKLHIHTLNPGNVLNFSQKFGEFTKMKIDNMSLQASENQGAGNNSEAEEELNISVISVNVGQGIIDDMKEIGADFIIEGGQTMNPSASDIMDAIKIVNSNQVIILPNNSNIILTAQQAAQAITNKKVIIIPTESQMQGLTAIMNFNREGTMEENKEEMRDAIESVKTGQITKATRNTKIEGVKIFKNEFLAIADKKILGSKVSKIDAAKLVVKKLIDEDTELVTIYYGEDSTEVDANEISSFIETKYDTEVEVKNGYQPIYNFLIAVE